jgi:CheY-like chemotaxis protein
LPRTILLADDSVTAQNMGRRILTDAGYEVITVNNGSAALKKIHDNPPDLVVLDVYMPGYGGLEVCQRLKESGETARIPVLLSVGKMEPFKIEEARRVRADGHIIKPFEASELLAALTRLEDRIVPLPDSAKGRGKKSEKKFEEKKSQERKSRFWQMGSDPMADAAPDPSGEIARLAELKRRQQVNEKEEEKENAPEQAPEPHIEAVSAPPATPAAAAPENAAAVEATAATAPPREFAPYAAERRSEEPAPEDQSPVTFASANLDQGATHDLTQDTVQAAEPAPGAEVELPETTASASASAPGLESSDQESPRAGEAASIEAASMPAAATEVASPEVASTETSSVAATRNDNPQDPSTPQPGRPRWVAENVALSREEASLVLDREMEKAQGAACAAESETRNEVPTSAEPAPVTSAAPHEMPPAVAEATASAAAEVQQSGAAFAAAASASFSASASAVSAVSREEAAATAGSETEPHVGYEAAAAWENWQQIRDRVLSTHDTEAIAKSVAEVAQACIVSTCDTATPTSPVTPAPVEGSHSASSGAPADSAQELGHEALASIVDSVLADLKPRLMQEIARKLKK